MRSSAFASSKTSPGAGDSELVGHCTPHVAPDALGRPHHGDAVAQATLHLRPVVVAPLDRHLVHRDVHRPRDRDRLRVPRVPHLAAVRQDRVPDVARRDLRSALRVDDARGDRRLEQPVVRRGRASRGPALGAQQLGARRDRVNRRRARGSASRRAGRARAGRVASRGRDRRSPRTARSLARRPAATAAPLPACGRRMNRIGFPGLASIRSSTAPDGAVRAAVVDEDHLAAGRLVGDELHQGLAVFGKALFLVEERYDDRKARGHDQPRYPVVPRISRCSVAHRRSAPRPEIPGPQRRASGRGCGPGLRAPPRRRISSASPGSCSSSRSVPPCSRSWWPPCARSLRALGPDRGRRVLLASGPGTSSPQHPPLLGTWTSASQSVGTDINNPGPLFFDAARAPGPALRLDRRARHRGRAAEPGGDRRHRGRRVPARRRGARQRGDARDRGDVLGHGQRAALRPVAAARPAAPVPVLHDGGVGAQLRRPRHAAVGRRRRQPRRRDPPQLRVPGARCSASGASSATSSPAGGGPGTSAPTAVEDRAPRDLVAASLAVTARRVRRVLGPAGVGAAHRAGRRQHHPAGAEPEQLRRGADRASTAARGWSPRCSPLPPCWLRPSFNDAFAPGRRWADTRDPGGSASRACRRSARDRRRSSWSRRSSRSACGTRRNDEIPRRSAPSPRGDLRSSSGSTPRERPPDACSASRRTSSGGSGRVAAFMTFATLATYGVAGPAAVVGPSRRVLAASFVGVTVLVAVLNLPTYRAMPGPTAGLVRDPGRPRPRSPARWARRATARCSTTSAACSSPSRTAPRSWRSSSGAASRSSSTSPASCASSGRTGATTGRNAKYRIFYRIGEDTLDPPQNVTRGRVPPWAGPEGARPAEPAQGRRSPTRWRRAA